MRWGVPRFRFICWSFLRCLISYWIFSLWKIWWWGYPVWRGRRWLRRGSQRYFPLWYCCGSWGIIKWRKSCRFLIRQSFHWWRGWRFLLYYSSPRYLSGWCWCSRWSTALAPRYWRDFRLRCGWRVSVSFPCRQWEMWWVPIRHRISEQERWRG